jgi:hypothetical protein
MFCTGVNVGINVDETNSIAFLTRPEDTEGTMWKNVTATNQWLGSN